MVLPLSLFKTGSEPVSVTAMRYQYFPASFVWRGEPREIRAVRRCWTSVRRDIAGRLNEYHHFRVRTEEGTFVLTRDLRRDRWSLAPDTPTRGPESRAA